MLANLENSAVATGLEKVSFHYNPNECSMLNPKKMFKLLYNCMYISHAIIIVLKILQTRLQQYMKWELPYVQDGLRKDRGTRDQSANIRWIIEKARKFQKKKSAWFCFIDYTKAFHCVDHKLLKYSSRNGNSRPPYLPPEKSVCK